MFLLSERFWISLAGQQYRWWHLFYHRYFTWNWLAWKDLILSPRNDICVYASVSIKSLCHCVRVNDRCFLRTHYTTRTAKKWRKLFSSTLLISWINSLLTTLFIFLFRFIPLHERIFLIEMALVGIVGGVATTYFALDSIINGGELEAPCYLQWFVSFVQNQRRIFGHYWTFMWMKLPSFKINN